jgi:hypothetical protein
MALAFVNQPRYHSRAIAVEEVRVTVGLLTHIYMPGETFEAEPADIIELAAQGKVTVPDYNRGPNYWELLREAQARLTPAPELESTKPAAKGR